MQQTTLQYRITTSKAGYRQLDQALLDMGLLYNALILHRKSATSSHRRRFSLSLQNQAITELRTADPQWKKYARRLMAETAKQANQACNAARKAGKRPVRTRNPHQHNTLQVSEPGKEHLKMAQNGKTATVHIKGLPTLQFRADHRIPADTQPRKIRITRTPKRVLLSLVFNRPEGPPMPAPEHSVGIDPGVKHLITAVGSDGAVLQVPGQDDSQHRKITRRLKRRMQRQRDSALSDGRARWVSQRTRSGRTKKRFRWSNRPSKNYLKCAAQLRRVEQKRADSLRGLHHRVSSHLVKTYQHICIEDTKTANMTKSAKGTAENPGKRVRQKAGLNREILSQGWYGLRQNLKYKCNWQGRTFKAVPAPYTSSTCKQCGYADAENRKSQESFHCLGCGHRDNADVNAAENIRRQGSTALVRADDPSERAAGDPSGKKRHTSLPALREGDAARRNFNFEIV